MFSHPPKSDILENCRHLHNTLYEYHFLNTRQDISKAYRFLASIGYLHKFHLSEGGEFNVCYYTRSLFELTGLYRRMLIFIGKIKKMRLFLKFKT
jgi:hypothetical protein